MSEVTSIRAYALVTAACWGFTVTDGAPRTGAKQIVSLLYTDELKGDARWLMLSLATLGRRRAPRREAPRRCDRRLQRLLILYIHRLLFLPG
jgi:hypothetical protein